VETVFTRKLDTLETVTTTSVCHLES